ncbi:uncharacterized protein [Pseudorasbora parva]|uniref:uncharacterized protein n=1 Tax=Pseudorasbora parva TaxID=51549 RepID=UPI00351E56DB
MSVCELSLSLRTKSLQTALSARKDAHCFYLSAGTLAAAARRAHHVLQVDFPVVSSQTDAIQSFNLHLHHLHLFCSARPCVCMMRVLFWTAVCVLSAGVRCVPLPDEQRAADCDPARADCDLQKTDDALNAQERHEGLLRELQELAEREKERERRYSHETDEYELNDTWDEDDEDEDEEGATKNERDLDDLLQEEIRETEIQRKQDEELEELLKELKRKQLEKKRTKSEAEEEVKRKNELELIVEKEKVEKELAELMNDTAGWSRQKEKEEKQEELQELVRKMERVQKEENPETDEKEPQQKREMENASDEATRQFERHGEEEEDRQREEEDEDEELLEIEAELRKVAAQLHELRRG